MKWSCETLIFPKLFLSSVSAAESSSALELCLFRGGMGLGILLPLELLISGASSPDIFSSTRSSYSPLCRNGSLSGGCGRTLTLGLPPNGGRRLSCGGTSAAVFAFWGEEHLAATLSTVVSTNLEEGGSSGSLSDSPLRRQPLGGSPLGFGPAALAPQL